MVCWNHVEKGGIWEKTWWCEEESTDLWLLAHGVWRWVGQMYPELEEVEMADPFLAIFEKPELADI